MKLTLHYRSGRRVTITHLSAKDVAKVHKALDRSFNHPNAVIHLHVEGTVQSFPVKNLLPMTTLDDD